MTDLVDAPPFPRLPLYGAGALVAFTMLAAFVGHVTGTGRTVESGPAIAARDLRFEDTTDGAVRVTDVANGEVVEVVEPGKDNFLRATMRGLARQRKRESLTDAVPFRLSAWPDGRLTLEDPATQRTVDLGAFGPTNAATFAQLLPLRGPLR
jgi:putative photosynthetic complex assembly protein